MKILALATLTAALSLGAGAAGLDTPALDADASAEGFWVATTPGGVAVKWGILDNGDTWGIYEARGTILGAFHGSTHSARGVLHGTGQAFDIPSRTVGPASYTGSYIPRTAITITTTSGISFSGRYVAGYEQPASPADLAGRFSGEGLSSRSPVLAMDLRFSETGDLAASGEGCTAHGSAKPRPGGKNVFNLTLHFTGSGCAPGDGASVSGIAHFSTVNGELFVLAMNEARTDGWLYLGAWSGD